MSEFDAAIASWNDDVKRTSKAAYARGLSDAVSLIARSYNMDYLPIPEGVDEVSYRSGLSAAFDRAASVVSKAEEETNNE